jgi:hypothetical protein
MECDEQGVSNTPIKHDLLPEKGDVLMADKSPVSPHL